MLMNQIQIALLHLLFLLMSCSSNQTNDLERGGGPAQNTPSALGLFDFERGFSEGISEGPQSSLQTSRMPASTTPSASQFNGQADWRILNFETPEYDFNVNEDLTQQSQEDVKSSEAFARISGVISAHAARLLEVQAPTTKSELDESAGPKAGALQQIFTNVNRLREKIKENLGTIRRIQQTVFFLPWPPDNRDLFHGYEKLSTEAGRASVDLIGVTPSHPKFQTFVTEQIKQRHEVFRRSVKSAQTSGSVAPPFQVLAVKTSVVYNTRKIGSIETHALIALRPGNNNINRKLGANLSLQEFVIPEIKERTVVALVKLTAGFGLTTNPWGRLELEFGEFDKFSNIEFQLKRGHSFLNGDLRKKVSPKFLINFDGKIWPDAKAYLGRIQFNLGNFKIEALNSQVGLRISPTIDKDDYLVEKANSTIQSKVDAAIRGELDHILLNILGAGGDK
jgi:hypothetical protein